MQKAQLSYAKSYAKSQTSTGKHQKPPSRSQNKEHKRVNFF